MTGFFKYYHSVRPWLINDGPPPEREQAVVRGQDELNSLYGASCACCSSVPGFWWNPDSTWGPPGFRAYRFLVDSRDQATGTRLDDLRSVPLFRCSRSELHGRLPEGLESGLASSQIRGMLSARSDRRRDPAWCRHRRAGRGVMRRVCEMISELRQLNNRAAVRASVASAAAIFPRLAAAR
jgi:succinate dehydrogenase / fumarate reductase iron-sulfur subunit